MAPQRRHNVTVKERLHQLIDLLDEHDAVEALVYLDQLVADAPDSGAAGRRDAGGVEVADREELLRLARPITADDSLWSIVGISGEEYDVPTDLAENHDKYLAEAYADLHEDDDSAVDGAQDFTVDDPLWNLVGIGSTAEP